MRTIILATLIAGAMWGQEATDKPFLVYSTYLGGNVIDTATAVTTDSDGNSYVVGDSTSTSFPWKNLLGPAVTASSNGWIAKIAPDGQKVTWAAAIGGRSNTRPNAVAIDPAGNIWVTGRTGSSDFPLLHPVQSQQTGLNIIFLMKISPEGKLLYSTLYGGERNDEPNAMAIDSEGNVILGGRAGSLLKFPFKNAMRHEWVGGEAFLMKFNNDGEVQWATYYGGSGNDEIFGVAVGPDNDIYVTGETTSNDIATAGAWITKFPAQTGFVSRVAADGSHVVWTTYVGGKGGYTRATAITLDVLGNPYVVGYTSAKQFPTTENALQREYAGGFRDAFLVQLAADGSTATYSTFLGGSHNGQTDPDDGAMSVKVDGHGLVYVGGITSSPDMLTQVRSLQDTPHGLQEYWLARVDTVNSKILFSTFWGGQKIDTFSGLALGPGENVTFVGVTYSGDFRVENPAQKSMLGTADATITRVCDPWLGSPSSEVVFYYTRGGTVPDPQEAALFDGCTLAHEATVAIADAGWATAEKDRVAMPEGKVKLFVNPAGLDPGEYKGTMTVVVPQAVNGPLTVSLKLVVVDPPPPPDPAPTDPPSPSEPR